VEGLLGKRISRSEGDADVYRIELEDDVVRVADIAVSALPNIDLALDLVEKGSSHPLLVIDSGKVGEPERIPNVGLRADTYYVRVRQVPGPARSYPIENVSDPYTISLALSAATAGREHELNDRFELAEPLTPGQPIEGRIGWAKDRDVYCASPGTAAQEVEVSGVPGLDLVLAYLDRRTDAGQRIDRQGVGEGERIALPEAKATRASCFTVIARERDGARVSDPERSYRIRLR